MDRLDDAFDAAFPGSDYRHHALFRREWASLAAVPFAPVENFDLASSLSDPDARRLIVMAEPMLRRIADVKAGAKPSPKWAEGHRDTSLPLIGAAVGGVVGFVAGFVGGDAAVRTLARLFRRGRGAA